jgi:hypothetical protein
VVKRHPYRARRRIFLISAAAFAVVVLALFLIPGKRPPTPSAAGESPALEVRAYMVATGLFAQPAPGQEPGMYTAAMQAAQDAGRPVAYAIWTDSDSFEAQGWRDVIGVRRIPISRPPKVDFGREVVVLAWPVPGKAPAGVLQAPGLSIRAAGVEQHGIALSVGPSTGGVVATPVGGGGVLPYALISVPRNQWPIPVPAPDVPPLVVNLTA